MTAAANGSVTPLTHRQVLFVVFGLILGTLLAALDQTILTTAVPAIAGDLGGVSSLSWVITSYMLTQCVSMPLFGKFGDLFGRKAVFQTAIVVFLAGSVLSGVSQTMGQLIAARGLQGLGAGGIIALNWTIIGDIVSPRQRGRYQGYTASAFTVSAVAGPLLGGFFVDHLSWRWAFFVNLPLGAAALAVTTVSLRLPFRRIGHAIDYLGAALLVGAISCLLLVTVWGGSQHPWGSAPILGLAGASALLFTLFALQERRAAEPILPPRLFRAGVMRVGAVAGVVAGYTLFGAMVFVPLYLQIVQGTTATNSGVLLLPLLLGYVIATAVTGHLITRTGRYKPFPVVGMAMSVVGLWLLSGLDLDSGSATTTAVMAFTGLGAGMVPQVLVLAVQNAVEHRDLGTATSAMAFFRFVGASLGIAVFGSILTDRLAYHLPRLVPASERAGLDPEQIQTGADQLGTLSPAVHDGVVEAFARSLHAVFMWAIPVAVIGFLAVLLLEARPLREWAHVGHERHEPVEPVAL